MAASIMLGERCAIIVRDMRMTSSFDSKIRGMHNVSESISKNAWECASR